MSPLPAYRPAFFSRYEWGYHLLMMPVLFPLGNYYFIGPRYFQELDVFLAGTALVFGLYWFSVVTLTLAIRTIIRRYPGLRQSAARLLVMFLAVGGLTIGLAVFDVWVYSRVPVTGVRFSWEAVRPIWVLGLGFDVLLCTALSLFYSYTHWQQDQAESEELQRLSLQRQYDTLKTQLKPHFLFNSLNSLSVLISEEPRRAEAFVEHLARVYRYLLQAGRKPMQVAAGAAMPDEVDGVPLQAELDFLTHYAELQKARFGAGLRLERADIAATFLTRQVLPLTLLTLLDHAIKHNVLSAERPLVVAIDVTTDGRLQVTNTHQPKKLRVEIGREELTQLMARYRSLTDEPVEVEVTESHFQVRLPLLPALS